MSRPEAQGPGFLDGSHGPRSFLPVAPATVPRALNDAYGCADFRDHARRSSLESLDNRLNSRHSMPGNQTGTWRFSRLEASSPARDVLVTRIGVAVGPAYMTGSPWTGAETGLSLADHFTMLAEDLSERRYRNAEHDGRQRRGVIGGLVARTTQTARELPRAFSGAIPHAVAFRGRAGSPPSRSTDWLR